MTMNSPFPANTLKKLEALRDELAERPIYTMGGVPCIQTKFVDREWERNLSDLLFRITGTSQFFGALAFQCRYHWSVNIPTAGAAVLNGSFHVVMNPLFMFHLLEKQSWQAFVIVHEVFHIFYDHYHRGESAAYNQQLFNVACDFYIHSTLDKLISSNPNSAVAGIEMIPKEVFPLCFDKKYDGMTEDEIYRDLLEEIKNNPQSGQGEEGEGDNGGVGSTYVSANGQQALDAPVQGDDGQSAEGNSTKNRFAVASAVRQAAVTASKSKMVGDVEAGIIRAFTEATEPRVDWKSEFMDYFETVRDCNLTYAAFNRRSNETVVFPSKTGEFIRVAFMVDTSGSMSDDDLGMAMTELQSILTQFTNWEVIVYSCDTTAYEIATLTSDECDDLTDLKIDLKGGGGTVMAPMIRMMQERDEDPFNVAVLVTDGYLNDGDIESAYEGEIPMVVLVTETGKVPTDMVKCITFN